MKLDDKEYPSNSIRQAERKPLDLHPPNQKRVERVTTGNVIKKKKNFADKFSETFWGDDAATIGNYVLYDVMIPAAKNMLFDMVITGVKMLLFGQSAHIQLPGRPTMSNQTKVSYTDFYNGAGAVKIGNERRATDFQNVVMRTRQDAFNVLTALLESIQRYSVATVADLYDAAGVTTSFTDYKFGWANLSDAKIEQTREGFFINLPPPHPLG